MKKNIIFIMSRMSIGGSQKSLVNAINSLDCDKYDITLYVRENKTDMISEIKKNINIVINENQIDYSHKLLPLFGEALKRFLALIKNKNGIEYIGRLSRDYIVKKKTDYEKKHYDVLNRKYDIAISYLQGFTCKFTEDCIDADTKICFYHNSTDALPDIHKEYLPKFNNIVVVSEETRNFLTERYPEISDKISVIKNIVDITAIRDSTLSSEIDKNDADIMLCTCGRISGEKGYDLAVDAAKYLKDKNYSFVWNLVGDGPQMDDLKKRVKEYNLEEYIKILGQKNNPYPWINSCDIYVQSSYEEAQPLTIMEAQILQKPVVSTNTVGARNLVIDGEDGIITDIDGESIGKGIEYLLLNKDVRNKMSEKLSDKDFEKYNKDILLQWEELLD